MARSLGVNSDGEQFFHFFKSRSPGTCRPKSQLRVIVCTDHRIFYLFFMIVLMVNVDSFISDVCLTLVCA